MKQKTKELTGVVILIVVIVTLTIIWLRYSINRDIVENAERAHIRMVADALDRLNEDTGRYQRVSNLGVKDTWGNDYILIYSDPIEGEWVEELKVRSCGWDGEAYTNDDFTITRMNIIQENINEDVQDFTRETSSNAMRGAIDGIRNYNED